MSVEYFTKVCIVYILNITLVIRRKLLRLDCALKKNKDFIKHVVFRFVEGALSVSSIINYYFKSVILNTL